MEDVYYFNGKFVNKEEAVIPIEERGYNFGEGVYEVIRSYNGKFFLIEEHIKRMEQGLKELNIAMPMTIEEFKKVCEKALNLKGVKDAHIYIQVSKGSAPRLHVPPKDIKPNLVIIAKDIPIFPDSFRSDGVKAILEPDIRWDKCFIKTTQLMPNTLAKEKAQLSGGFEAIFHKDNFITEAGSSNVFIVKSNHVKTHPATENILHGVTRKVVLDILKNTEYEVKEEKFTIRDLIESDETFISGTGTEIMPIVRVDDKIIGNGKPGNVTKRIIDEFAKITNSL